MGPSIVFADDERSGNADVDYGWRPTFLCVWVCRRGGYAESVTPSARSMDRGKRCKCLTLAKTEWANATLRRPSPWSRARSVTQALASA